MPTEPVLAKKEDFFMNSAIAVSSIVLIVLGLWMPVSLERVLREAVTMIGV